MYRLLLICLILFLINSYVSSAQVLPAHDPLRILIVSDEVNPHNLSDEQLTQPGDISNALLNSSALNTAQVLEIPTAQIEAATTELLRPFNDPQSFDVLIYFAHRNPDNGNSAQSRQEQFVNAVETFLQAGGGVVSFHHGIYLGTGKQSIQNLLGAQAIGAVPWDTINGQDIIYVGGDHFIGTHQINYDQQIAYENADHDVSAGNYPAFNNTPDERYPQMDFNNGNTGCQLKVLYESDYNDNGNTHLLSYTKFCSGWGSQIFVYQPGEYQPNALSGNNLQILLNSIYYLTAHRWDIIFSNRFE
jgi:hypothetical protein